MKIAMIDDNTTMLMLTEAKLKAIGAIQTSDTFQMFGSAIAFFKEYNVRPEFDFLIVDHDLGLGVMWGNELIILLESDGFKGICVLFTSDESAKLKAIVTPKNAKYVCKRSIPNEKDPYIQIAEMLDDIRQNVKKDAA